MNSLERRRPIGVLVCILLLVLLAGCNGRDDSWQRIQQRGVMRVGLDPTFPPFETADDGDLRGIDVDLARAIGDDLGVAIEFVYFGYDGLYDALATGQVDVLLSALVVQLERTRDFAYSDSYFNAGQVLIVRQTEDAITGMADLSGRHLAVEIGSQGHVEALTWSRRLAELAILSYNTSDEALTAVTTNEADAALIDAISGRLYLQQEPTLKLAATAVTVEPYALVVRIDDRTLLEQLNSSLGRLRASGELDKIINSWLAPQPVSHSQIGPMQLIKISWATDFLRLYQLRKRCVILPIRNLTAQTNPLP
jgi:arginine/lysine/histidine transporter system substrate-binding protein